MNRHVFFKIITVWFLLIQTIPFANLLFPIGGLLKYAVFCGVSIALFPDLLTKRSVVALFIYGLVMLIYHILGNVFFETINSVVVPLIIMLSALIMVEYSFMYDNDYKYTRMVVLFVFLANILMAIMSIPQLLINPGAIRPSGDGEFYMETHYFVTSYHTCHGLPILFAPLMFLCRRTFRNNKKMFYFWTATSALLFYLILLSGATTSLLISIIMIGLGLYYNKESLSTNGIRSFVVVIIISIMMFQPAITVPVINTVQKTMDPMSGNYRKMEQIKDDMIYGETEGDWDARQRRYDASLGLFIESPLTGTTSPERIALHSWFIDRLACFGIIFIIPLIVLFVRHFKTVFNGLIHTKITYIMGFLGLVLFLILKNDFGPGTWLYGFSFLPLLCRYIDFVIDNKCKSSK